MEKKFVKVEVSHGIGDTGWIRTNKKYTTRETKCPACDGKKTLTGADNREYNCPYCGGAGKLPKGTHCGYNVVKAEVVGMMLQDVQVGMDTTGTRRIPRIVFDTKYKVEPSGYRFQCTSQIFNTKEEAERL